ncbi:hypothetical protein FHX42_002518 [Saccharopolyspora lacisalsi]|uniref:Uncharacterized protein n=1 Tax=Halosaccharopolyspora lacisalsi TaxID=1000566 RepID=A0A839E098_9PSEU|nr:hypothetical protein [Halosaccharopolyspora lacisalsi]MBA8825167.1 hypothetical protein [Halosaccharopolyspora lacisalsi]
MLTMLRQKGVTSDHMFAAGLGSIALSVIVWAVSLNASEPTSRADRWGIFVGEWAPSFFALGVGLRIDENQNPKRGR